MPFRRIEIARSGGLVPVLVIAFREVLDRESPGAEARSGDREDIVARIEAGARGRLGFRYERHGNGTVFRVAGRGLAFVDDSFRQGLVESGTHELLVERVGRIVPNEIRLGIGRLGSRIGLVEDVHGNGYEEDYEERAKRFVEEG